MRKTLHMQGSINNTIKEAIKDQFAEISKEIGKKRTQEERAANPLLPHGDPPKIFPDSEIKETMLGTIVNFMGTMADR